MVTGVIGYKVIQVPPMDHPPNSQRPVLHAVVIILGSLVQQEANNMLRSQEW